jgi:uncharacterized MnhB-related membrane protein
MTIWAVLQLLTLSMVVIGSILAVWLKDLLAAVIALGGSSLLLALQFYLLQAPDVAIAEAGVGAALSTAIFVLAIRKTRRKEEE